MRPFDALSLEVFGLVDDRPDRAASSRQRTISGTGLFLRAAAEKSGWRGHVIVWRGNDFNHEDGDAHYQSHYATGAPDRGTRDYGESGLTKLFRPAPGVDVEASGRLHRVERDVGYSFRLVALPNCVAHTPMTSRLEFTVSLEPPWRRTTCSACGCTTRNSLRCGAGLPE